MKKNAPKPKQTKYFIFNIKILSPSRSGDEAYKSLITELFKKKIMIPVPHDKQMILRTQFFKLSEEKEFYSGKISKFTKIDGREWINLDNLEVVQVEIPKNRFPNLKETDYVFVPGAHRFAIVKNADISISGVYAFLTEGLRKILKPEEQIEVFVHQSSDIFEEIIKAPSIEKLKINITYTNDDILEGAEEYMDDLLKTAGIGNLSIEAKADHNKNISVNNDVIGGALMLARSNGTVEAKIVNADHRKQTLKTEHHPETFNASYIDDKSDAIAKSILNEFRNGE